MKVARLFSSVFLVAALSVVVSALPPGPGEPTTINYIPDNITVQGVAATNDFVYTYELGISPPAEVRPDPDGPPSPFSVPIKLSTISNPVGFAGNPLDFIYVSDAAGNKLTGTAAHVSFTDYPFPYGKVYITVKFPIGTQVGTFAWRIQPDWSGVTVNVVDAGTTVNATVKPPPSTLIAPTITSNPANTAVGAGQSATLSVQATGSEPRTYTWYKRVGGADTFYRAQTTPDLVFANATLADAGQYYVVVSNGQQPNATSPLATLAVIAVSDLLAVYDGTPKPTTAAVAPAGLSYSLTYSNSTYASSTTAPTNAGTYVATGTITAAGFPATGMDTGMVEIAKRPQSIVFEPAAATSVSVGAASFNLNAKVKLVSGAPSPLAPTYSSSNPAVATVDGSGNVTVLAAGTTTFTVQQSGDQNHSAAADATHPLTVVSIAPPPPPPGPACGTVLVRHTPTMNGQAAIDGSVHVLLAEDMAMNGQAWISGSLLLPGTPNLRLNGKPTIGAVTAGTGAPAPSTHTLTLNGQPVIGKLVRRTDPVPMPTVVAPVATGTRDITINKSSDIPASFANVRDVRVNGNAGIVTLPGGNYRDVTFNGKTTLVLGTRGATTPTAYELRSLTLSGAVAVKVQGPVAITIAESATLSGNFGVVAKPAWVSLKIARGGLTLNGGICFAGYVVAPNGTVTLNGRDTLRGGLTADRLVLNGQGLVDVTCPDEDEDHDDEDDENDEDEDDEDDDDHKSKKRG